MQHGAAPQVAAQAAQLSEAEFKAQAKQKAMQLGKTLKKNLQQAVKEGGLPNGVQVCKDIAPAIAVQYIYSTLIVIL